MSLALLDWRRTVAAMYADVRRESPTDPEGALRRFRDARDRLFASHPESPLGPADRATFAGIPYWPYDPELRFEVEVDVGDEVDEAPIRGGDAAASDRSGRSPEGIGRPSVAAVPITVEARSLSGEAFALERVGRVRLPIGELDVYWIAVYGGGLFLPFRDATSGSATYGAGRYLLDTVKGADLGGEGRRLVLDFNYAYHPSCAYDPRWSCPLAPPANRLPVAIEAGERL